MRAAVRGDVSVVSCGRSSSFFAVFDEGLEVESSALILKTKHLIIASDIRHEFSDK